LFILPFDKVTPILKKISNIHIIRDIKDYIFYYEVMINGSVFRIEVEDMWYVQTSSLKIDNGDILKPNNRLDSLVNSLSNIRVANKAKNIVLDRNGFMGFFSNDAGKEGDFNQVTAFDEHDEEKFQKFLDGFGFNDLNKQFALTNLNLKYHKVDFDINSLKINEGLDYELKTIADVFKFDLLLLNQVKGSTFSNKEQAEKAFYQNSIIPTTKIISNSLKSEFELEEDVYFDFSHLAILQEDLLKLSQYQGNQTQTILSINSQIAQGQLTYDVGISILENILQISNELAGTLIGNYEKTTQANTAGN